MRLILTGISSKKMPRGRKKSTKKYTYAIGRRKQATAIVRLFKGKGESIVNGKKISDYFPGVVNKYHYQKPLEIAGVLGKFYATIMARGSGKQSQLEAVALALSRALEKVDREKYRPLLKREGFLTVDSRVRERRKAGQMGRARKKKQSPKR